MEIKISKEEKHRLAEEYVLNIYRLGADPINYKILRMLPTTTDKIRTEINRSKMPSYYRLRELRKYGLVSWRKGTAVVEKGELTDKFLESVGGLCGDIEISVIERLLKISV